MISSSTRQMMNRWRTHHTMGIFTYHDLERKHNAAMKIQKVWRRCVSNPEYSVCKRRLLREFRELC